MKLRDRWRALFPKNSPQAGAITLGQRRLYVLPTRLGLVFLAMLGMMFSGAVNYDLSLGYGLVFWLLSVMLLSAVHANLNLADLKLGACFERRSFAGEPLSLQLSYRQPKPRNRPSLCVLQGRARTVFDAAEEEGDARLSLPGQARGRFRLPRLTLETRYPLGLFRCWTYLDFELQELVYPAPESPAPSLPTEGLSANQGERWWNGGDEFAGLREWRPEDAPRLIAWRQSARNNQMLTKTFQVRRGRELWLDWSLTAGDTEKRLSRLCSWIVQADALGYDYGLRLPQLEYRPAHGPKHREQCLAALALF